MSIINNVSDKLPREGQIVYCDNGKYSEERAFFEGGEFIGGGEWPVKSHVMSCVKGWFCLDEYRKLIGGGGLFNFI